MKCLEISTPGFMNPGYTIDIWGWITLCYGGGRAARCIVESLAVFLASPHYMPEHPSQVLTIKNVPWKAQSTPAENHISTPLCLEWLNLGGSSTGNFLVFPTLFLITLQWICVHFSSILKHNRLEYPQPQNYLLKNYRHVLLSKAFEETVDRRRMEDITWGTTKEIEKNGSSKII